jgi:gluconokinase
VIIVLMGVSGCGKTTIGEALARRLDWLFIDADTLHPVANVAKMRAGVPLDDDDRAPWLARIVDELRALGAQGRSAVLACSALREAYRRRIRDGGDVRFVYLAGDFTTIAARLAARHHRYMPASLLESQFATLEEPHDALRIDIRMSIEEQVESIVDVLAPQSDERPDGALTAARP